jgi:YrbI family 3-deoxy-D-manno-octulosonate 8-phosphate phosphatase
VLPPVFWQTGHIDAIRPRVFNQESMSGAVILPVTIDPSYSVDIDTPKDWARSEWLVWHGGLDIVYPGRRRRPLPDQVDLVVFDFDGVLTDNRVWVNEEGQEMVAANRSDSLGLSALRLAGIEPVVLSTEVNPVVTARCRKMRVPVWQGVDDKYAMLLHILQEKQVDPAHVIYVGNDTNDLPCFPVVACAIAVADAQPVVLLEADFILSQNGGHGAVRELCDLLIQRVQQGVRE